MIVASEKLRPQLRMAEAHLFSPARGATDGSRGFQLGK
jgi:hypothetical protein